MVSSVDGGETQRLQSLSKYEILDSPPEAVFDDLTALAANVCDAPMSLLTFLDKDREWFKSSVGLHMAELPRASALCAETINQHELLVVPDTTKDQRFANNPLVTGEPHVRFYASYPLISAEGHSLGALSVLDKTPHKLTARQQLLLQKIGHEATMLLELRREINEQRHENERQAAELKRLHENWLAEKTEHRRAEEDLLHRERQLADAQRLAVLGSWELDLKSGHVTWSDELYRLFGLRPGEFAATYEAYLKCVHPDDRAKADALIRATLETKGSFVYEKRIVRPDGSVRTLFSTGEVILDEDNQPVRMVGCAQDITQRKEMEEKLQTTVSLLHATLESTADGILVVDLNGRLLRHNRRFLELWRLPADLMEAYDDRIVLERVLHQLVDPKAFLAKVQDLYNHPEEDSFDILAFKDGRIFERYSRPQKLGESITGRVWSFRDVTERCRAVEALRRSEERYRGLVDATAQFVWTANPVGDVVEDSPSWRQFTGQSQQEMTSRGWMNAIHPDDQARVEQAWSQAVADHSHYQVEHRVHRIDGKWRHVIARAVPIFDETSNLREWVGFCIDITDRKNAEEAVAAERDLSNAMINSLPGVFYLLDETGAILRWNRNVEEISAYSSAEVSTMRATDFVAEEDKALVMKRINQVFQTGEAEMEVNFLRKRGKPIAFFCTGKLVHIGGQARLIGMGIDVSKRKQAEEEVRKLNQQLEVRVQERTEKLNSINNDLQAFSYTVSHDLKAPLRAISGFAEAIIDDCSERLDEEHRVYLERVRQAADRMTHLIEDLLTYSRLGQTALNLHPVKLSDLVPDIVIDFRFQLDAIGGQISVAPDLPVVNADPTLLSQVFTNLIENAITYRKTDVPLKICINCRREADRFIICVADNGIGIAPAHQQRIFEVFQRLHTTEQYPGTGIGLANVRKAVELQGGRVWVESELGKGSTFCIDLQAAKHLPQATEDR